MIRLTLKDLWAHKRRLVSTMAAVFIGVAFLAGTLALSDTLRANFADLFTQANAGTDAVIRSTTSIDADTRGPVGSKRGLVDAALVPEVQQIDGVASASASIEGYGQLLGRDGSAVGGIGPPRLAGNWIDDPALNPYRIVEGRAPHADDEVVINRGAAKDGDLHVGDSTVVQTPDPVTVRIVGIATYGAADGAGRTTFTAFTLPAAQRDLAGGADEATSILVHGDGTVSQSGLVARLQPVLPGGTEAITGTASTQENIDNLNATFLDSLTTALTVFAGVALLVGAFSIFNTFSILVAQRTRQSALVRALGASRRQVVRSVVIEALLVGAVASAAGLGGGIAVAGLLKAMFDAFGFSLPAGGLTITTTSMIVPLVVGTLVTVGAGLGPAIRASRVPPLAAMREVAVDRTGASPARAVAGAAILAVGVALTLVGAVGSAGLAVAGLGALLTVVGVVVFGPVVARTASGAIGAPVQRLRGVTGALARDNAMRSPRRTAGTASALMVGVAVVTLFTVFAASLKSSINDAVERSFAGDLAVTTGTFGGALSPQLASDLAALPQVRAAAGLGRGVARIAGQDESVTVADPAALPAVLDLGVTAGAIGELGTDGIAVSSSAARSHHWSVGSTVPVTFTDGTTTDLRVGAVYDEDDLPGPYILPRAAWAPHAVQDLDATVYVALADGVSRADGTAAVEGAAAPYGNPEVLDRAGYVAEATRPINVVLGLVYVMLALAVVIALLGIANTLSLSILERTRELGVLRAVGATRARLRSMVRWESVIIALFGTIGGLGVGLFLGWALTAVALDAGSGVFTAPVAQLAVVLVAGGVAGVLAAVRPARRAGRLDVLAAIATE